MCYNATVVSDSNVPLFIVGGRGAKIEVFFKGFGFATFRTMDIGFCPFCFLHP